MGVISGLLRYIQGVYIGVIQGLYRGVRLGSLLLPL